MPTAPAFQGRGPVSEASCPLLQAVEEEGEEAKGDEFGGGVLRKRQRMAAQKQQSGGEGEDLQQVSLSSPFGSCCQALIISHKPNRPLLQCLSLLAALCRFVACCSFCQCLPAAHARLSGCPLSGPVDLHHGAHASRVTTQLID